MKVEICCGKACLYSGNKELLKYADDNSIQYDRIPCKGLCLERPIAYIDNKVVKQVKTDDLKKINWGNYETNSSSTWKTKCWKINII